MAKINPWKVTGYKAGQNVACKVNYAEEGGYAVTIQKDNLPGFIKTTNVLKVGEELLGVFVCVHQGRILLTPLFATPRTTAHQLAQNTVNWQEHLSDPDSLDQAYEQQAQTQRNQRLGINEEAAYLAQQASAAPQSAQITNDYDQYQSGGAGNGQSDMGQQMPPPGQNPYQDSNQNPYQNPAQTAQAQYSPDQAFAAQFEGLNPPDANQNPWANPQQAQYESGQQAPFQGEQQSYQAEPNPYQQQNASFQPPATMDQVAAAQQAQLAQSQMAQQAPPQHQAEQQWESPHTQVPTKRFRLRRAIDLVMPPVDQDGLEGLKTFKIADYDMEWLITDLEGGMRTGCIKATSEQKLSRSAALLYRGRAVGCIYGCKASPDAKPTEESLSAMLTDLEAPDAVVTLYDLPEDVTIAMSALFLGYSIDTNPDMSAREYSDFVMKWFAENGSTACLAVTVSQTKSTYLVFVHKGKFAGVFFVEEQQFTRDANEILSVFNTYPDAHIEASLLNAEMLNSGMRFGYSLTMARKKGTGF
ncbi:MAG: hypothetical protein KGS72_12185 [Cyanobacteria bacterium REEB67]|nr:hypothetical protein [Cyanobacteria bacterium REEB67]